MRSAIIDRLIVSLANIVLMAAETASIAPDTVSDRDILLHILSRVESMWEELEQFRPLLTMLKTPDGRPDMVGVLQARRQARKAARGG